MFSPTENAVTKEKLAEVYFLADIDNLPSILKEGVLSRNEIKKKGLYDSKSDISNREVQARREKDIVSPYDKVKRNLHDYANLYIQPFNAMMAAVAHTDRIKHVCVIRVSKRVLNVPGTLVTNRNAACSSVKFFKPTEWRIPSPEAVAIRSRYITGSAEFLEEPVFTKQKQIRQSEVLVLDRVLPTYIDGIFVPNEALRAEVAELVDTSDHFHIDVIKHPSLFLKPSSSPNRGRCTAKLEPFSIISSKKRSSEAITVNAFSMMKRSCPTIRK